MYNNRGGNLIYIKFNREFFYLKVYKMNYFKNNIRCMTIFFTRLFLALFAFLIAECLVLFGGFVVTLFLCGGAFCSFVLTIAKGEFDFEDPKEGIFLGVGFLFIGVVLAVNIVKTGEMGLDQK
jgi:hypothetical protein